MRTIGCMCLHSPPYPCTHTDLEQGSSPYSRAAKMNGLISREKGSAMSFKNLKSISQETSSLPHLKVSSCKNIHTFLGQWYLALLVGTVTVKTQVCHSLGIYRMCC